MSATQDANTMLLETYLADVLTILRTSLKLARQGQRFFYRVAALQLRILLCDSTRLHNRPLELGLLPRLRPRLALHPLTKDGAFDRSAPPIPLQDWLNQPLPLKNDSPLTIRRLIREVCDRDGGAHVDVRAHLPPASRAERAEWILHLGEYLLSMFPEEISAHPRG